MVFNKTTVAVTTTVAKFWRTLFVNLKKAFGDNNIERFDTKINP